MEAIMQSFVSKMIKVVIYAVIAWAGIVLGKDYAMKKAAEGKDAK